GHAQACCDVAQRDLSGFGGGTAFEEVPEPGGTQDDGGRRGERGAEAQRSGDHLHYGRERESAVPAEGRWRFIEYDSVRAEEGQVCGDLWTGVGGGGGFVEEREYGDAGFSGRIPQSRRAADQGGREDDRLDCVQRGGERSG